LGRPRDWSSAFYGGRRTPGELGRVRHTWQTLATEQLINAVFIDAQYNLVSWALNSFGVLLDDFLPRAGP